MAIRMREWGMLSVPGRRVQIPVDGMLGWADEARRMGAGVSQLLETGAALAEEKQKVEQVAEQAALASRMQEVSAETAREMQDAPVRDWDYSWQQASEARLAEAVADLPPERREAARALASLYNRQASLEARRDYELGRIDQARQRWQQELDRAVQRGDEEQAGQWLRMGQDVFVPAGQMEDAQRDVKSRSCLSRWRGRMEAQPLETLSALDRAGDAELPAGEQDARSLSLLAEQTRRNVRRGLADRWAAGVRQGALPDAQEAQTAFDAGLVTAAQFDAVRKPALQENDRARSFWMRLVDECPDDEESRTGMMLDVVTAPLPVSERAALLRRLHDTGQVALADRRAFSQGLYRLFQRGCMGNPADAQACRRYAALQREGLPVLLAGGAEASADWLRQQREAGERWVCFESV